MKKITFFVMSCIALQVHSQSQMIEDHHVTIEDTIIRISQHQSDWNYSVLNFNNYPNTLDIDLKQIQDVSQIYQENQFLQVNETVIGDLPITNIIEDGINFNIIGNYSFTKGSKGNLILSSSPLQELEKTIYVETYFLMNEGDTLASYENTYFSFFDFNSKKLIFEIFKKTESLKGDMDWVFYGISNCAVCLNKGTQANINISCSPNPSYDNSIISFDLPIGTDVTISITNQDNTVNKTLFTGKANNGHNEYQFSTKNYITGSYTLTVITSTGKYTTSLIIL